MRREMRRKMADAADPLVRKVRRSVMDMHSEKDQDYSFRSALAGTVYASVTNRRTGVSVDIISSGRRMPAGMQNLNANTDRARGWGHPVYADTSESRRDWTWVRQWGKPGWFEKPIIADHAEFKQAVQEAIDEVDRFLSD